MKADYIAIFLQVGFTFAPLYVQMLRPATSYAILAYPQPASSAGPPAALYVAHPEWFWPRGEEGASTYGQLCWSNVSLQQYMVKQVKAYLNSAPNAT